MRDNEIQGGERRDKEGKGGGGKDYHSCIEIGRTPGARASSVPWHQLNILNMIKKYKEYMTCEDW